MSTDREPVANIRQSIFEKHELISNSQDSTKKFVLPQAFLWRTITTYRGKTKEKEQKKRFYLGDYPTIQYLEDSGLLDSMLFPKVEELDAVLNIQYRIFEGVPILRCAKTKMDNMLQLCTMTQKERKSLGFKFEENEVPFEVHCNFEDAFDVKAHQLCQFFEKN